MSNKNVLTNAEQFHEESQNILADYKTMVSSELQAMMAMQEQQQAFFDRLDNRHNAPTPKAKSQAQPSLQQAKTDSTAPLRKL